MTKPDIAFFLLARIANDRKIAEAAPPAPWSVEEIPDDKGIAWGVDGPVLEGEEWPEPVVVVDFDRDYQAPRGGCINAAAANYIAHWDPARILAECDAKEELVKEYLRIRDMANAAANYDLNTVHTFTASARTATSALEAAVRYLALPYANHRNYQEEWRP
jgi:hypothetical protein